MTIQHVRPAREAVQGGRGFRPDVEGLRAVAIVLVVLYHCHVHAISGGYVGVDVFFVISGFLITGQLARELERRGRISFLGFYARRARRILPAATLVTVSTVVASSLLLSPIAARRVLDDAVAAVYFGVNFRFASEGANYFDQDLPPSPLQHFWSLSVEEQFYVVWPLLLVLSSLVWVRRRHARRNGAAMSASSPDDTGRQPNIPVVVGVLVAIVVVSFTASVLQTAHSPSWAYYSILTRAWELAIGALAALAVPLARRLDPRVATPLTWIGLVAIAVAAVAYGPDTQYPGHAALLPVLGAAAVVVGGTAAAEHRGAVLLLGTPPFQRVGSWSYSWYLWHWPALILVPVFVGHALTVPQNLAVALAALVVSVASYVLVERPIRRMQLVVRRPVFGVAGGGVLAASALAVVLVSGSLLPSLTATGKATHPAVTAAGPLTAKELTKDLEAGNDTTKVPSNLTPPLSQAAGAEPIIVRNGCHLQHPQTRSKPCIYGDTSSKTDVVLFGDSHAAAWFPALEKISLEEHWRLIDLTKAGCPPVEVSIKLIPGDTPYPQCATWRQNSLQYISALDPLLVVAVWARYLEVPEASALAGVPRTSGYSVWQDGVDAVFKFLHAHAQHTAFLSDGPTLSQLAPDCVSGHLDDVKPCTTLRSTAVRLPTVKAQELSLAKSDGIDGIDPDRWFCSPSRCPVIVGNIFLYRDDAHMTPEWSDFIYPVLGDDLVPLVGSASSSGHT